jgi:hypothetical protein
VQKRSLLRPTTLSSVDLVLVTSIATVVSIWAGLAAGEVSVAAWLCCEAVFVAFYLAGSLVSASRPIATGVLFDLPLRLLVGYALVNTALFALAWILPLSIAGDFALVSVLLVAALLATRPVLVRGGSATAGRWAIVLALVGATLWCQDSLRPLAAVNGGCVIKPWTDGFIHASQIRMLSVAHGAASIQDYRMAGVTARLYHYAAYMTPALIKHVSALPSYAAFAGILVPTGIFFTGLGAYVLTASFFGPWSGLAACAALLLVPDGAQQGMRNTFLSYHWLAQISPGATFGLSIAALAWVFILRGCLRGRLFHVGLGWLVGGVLVLYKAQLFVAVALLLVTLPALFFRRRLGMAGRLVWLATAIGAFVGAVLVVDTVPSVPLIRLDGSSTQALLKLILSYASPTELTHYVAIHVGHRRPWTTNLLYGAPYLLAATSGFVLPTLVVLLLHLRKRMASLLVLFPLAIAANFVVMALGMALDTRHVGTSEELQHRPLLLMHFVLTAWMGALGALALLRSRWIGRRARPILAALILLLVIVPAVHGKGVQRISTMPHESDLPLPQALLRITDFMRSHGQAADVFQASSLDPRHIIAGLADRQPYYGRQLLWLRESEKAMIDKRTAEVAHLMQLRDAYAINAAARHMGLRWFLLSPTDSVAWPDSLSAQVVLAVDGHKLYVFD